MKLKYLFILLLLAGLGYSVYHFDLINSYINKPSQDTTATGSQIPEHKKTKKRKDKQKTPRHYNPYKKIEDYALNTPKKETSSIEKLAAYLSKGGTNDYEKARIVYRWITANISYDDKAYNSNDFPDQSAEEVLKSRKGVCEGYSNLYKALCNSMGLEAIKISGYAKGYGYKIGDHFKETDHAWNAVKMNGEWKLVDATWGEGFGETVNGKLKSVKKYNPYWFATNPYEFLFKHYPENSKLQFTSLPITKEQYEKLAYIDKGVFQLGASAKLILTNSLDDITFQAPEAWPREYELSIVDMELNQNLQSSKEYSFKIQCKEDIDVAIVNQNKWTYCKKENNYYIVKIKPLKGVLTLNTKLKGFENSYCTIVKYKVR